eukprot:284436-Pelagomonas_calceolata.AAC.1
MLIPAYAQELAHMCSGSALCRPYSRTKPFRNQAQALTEASFEPQVGLSTSVHCLAHMPLPMAPRFYASAWRRHNLESQDIVPAVLPSLVWVPHSSLFRVHRHKYLICTQKCWPGLPGAGAPLLTN